jgi:hypothetical protein
MTVEFVSIALIEVAVAQVTHCDPRLSGEHPNKDLALGGIRSNDERPQLCADGGVASQAERESRTPYTGNAGDQGHLANADAAIEHSV